MSPLIKRTSHYSYSNEVLGRIAIWHIEDQHIVSHLDMPKAYERDEWTNKVILHRRRYPLQLSLTVKGCHLTGLFP